MSLTQKLTFGIFYLLSSSFVTLGINIIIVGFIARSLGVENFGLYSAIFSFVGLFQFLSDFGLNKTLLKFGSIDRTQAQISFGNALFVKTILAVPTIFLITFLGFLSGYRSNEMIILLLFAVSLVFESYATVFSSVRRILGSFKLVSFFRILKTVINLIIIVFAFSVQNSVLSLALANAALNIVIFIVSFVNTALLLKPKLRIKQIRYFFSDSIIFSLNDFFLNIYARLSTVLLSLFYDLHTVGIYGAAVRFTRIANLLPNQVKFALLPTMYRLLDNKENDTARRRDGDTAKEKKVFSILLKYLIIFSTPLVLSIFFFSDSMIHVIFGKKYDLSIPLVKLFSLFIFLRFIETPFNLFYIAMNKHKNMVYFQGITSLLNVILNLILIPAYSVFGACYATLISEIFFVLLMIIMGRKYLIWKVSEVFNMLMKPVVSGFIGIGIITIFLSKINIFIQVALLIVCYFLLLIAFKTFDKNDKELLKKIFVKQNMVV